MKGKKLSCALLVLILILSSVPVFAAVPEDAQDNWGKGHIQWALDFGLVQGYEDGFFRPDNNTTRAEFVAIVNRFIGAQEEEEVYFTDVDKSDWYYGQLKKAAKAGYIDKNGAFRGGDFITRDETLGILAKVYRIEGKTLSRTYSDVAQVQNKSEFGAFIEKGIIKGYPDNTLKPGANLTRAEMCALFERCNENFGRPIVMRKQLERLQIENKPKVITLSYNYSHYYEPIPRPWIPQPQPWKPEPWTPQPQPQTWEPQVGIIYKTVGDGEISVEEAKAAIANLPEAAIPEIIRQPDLSQAGNDTLLVRVNAQGIKDKEVSIPVVIKEKTGGNVTPVATYKIIFDSNGGTPVDEQHVKEGTKAFMPETPKLEGHTFVEWQLNGVAFDFDTVITSDITLVAKWQENIVEEDPVVIADPQGEIPTGYVRVTFTAQTGGDFGAGVATKKYDVLSGKTWAEAKNKGLILPTPIASEEYEFNQWTPAIPDDRAEVKTAEYIANFTQQPVEQCVVTFNSHYGTKVEAIYVDKGAILTPPLVPKRGGGEVVYTFGGWYTDWNRTQPFEETQPVNSDITLHAKWNMVGGYSTQQNSIATRMESALTTLINTVPGKTDLVVDKENREGLIKICDPNAKVADSFSMKTKDLFKLLETVKAFWNDGLREIKIGDGPWRVMPKPTIFNPIELKNFGEALIGDIGAAGFDLSNKDMTLGELLGKTLKIRIKTLDGRIDEYNIGTEQSTSCQ